MSETHLRQPRRVRHELKFRRARVEAVEQLTLVLKRIVLTGEQLEGFFSPGFDDHVKIFPTPRGQAVVLPTAGPDGPVFPDPKPVARDYTPRAFDAANLRLTNIGVVPIRRAAADRLPTDAMVRNRATSARSMILTINDIVLIVHPVFCVPPVKANCRFNRRPDALF